MTTYTWQLYNELSEYAGSVTVVHPPQVALITRSQVMNDKIAASILARLLAEGLLVGIWVPLQEVRELRGLVAQRKKMTRLATQAKNRMHAVLQRHHLVPPEGNPLQDGQREWWLDLPLGKLERANLRSDLDALRFAEKQRAALTSMTEEIASQDEQITRLMHLSGFGVVTAITIWAAIGDIRRFAEPKGLVSYAGLSAKVYESGISTRSRITKAGRRDLRTALIEAVQVAASTHPHWKADLVRLKPHLGRNKAIAAIARELLICVWSTLFHQVPDRFAKPESIAQKFLKFAYRIGKNNRPAGQSAGQFVGERLDVLQPGNGLTSISWGSEKPIALPPTEMQKRKERRPN